MKQFNLQEYLANPSLKIVTRDGRPARVVCTDVKGNYPVIGLALHNDTEEYMYNFTENGRWSTGIKSDRDLFFLEQEHVNSSFTPEKNKKFDPHTLRPFDKVLIKTDDDLIWSASLFSHLVVTHDDITGIDYLNSVTLYCITPFCIPYNDDTKYLIGTTKEVSEYYRYWED